MGCSHLQLPPKSLEARFSTQNGIPFTFSPNVNGLVALTSPQPLLHRQTVSSKGGRMEPFQTGGPSQREQEPGSRTWQGSLEGTVSFSAAVHCSGGCLVQTSRCSCPQAAPLPRRLPQCTSSAGPAFLRLPCPAHTRTPPNSVSTAKVGAHRCIRAEKKEKTSEPRQGTEAGVRHQCSGRKGGERKFWKAGLPWGGTCDEVYSPCWGAAESPKGMSGAYSTAPACRPPPSPVTGGHTQHLPPGPLLSGEH